ncbi:hypothetical protein CHCC14816_1775 [Bacillus licheniformis]|nr:hypothetical protein CHCC14816_1775 [Bacillus licheniformis]
MIYLLFSFYHLQHFPACIFIISSNKKLGEKRIERPPFH